MSVQSKSLASRVLVFVLVLAVIATTLMGGLAYSLSRDRIRQAVFRHSASVATLKEDEARRWLANQRQQVSLIASLRPVREWTTALNSAEDADDPAYLAAYDELSRYLSANVLRRSGILELFVISNADGQVIASSDAARVGQSEGAARYFIEGQRALFIQKVYRAVDTDAPTMTLAVPIISIEGESIAVLAAHLDLEMLHQIVLLRPGLGATSESYLVDTSRRTLSASRVGTEIRERMAETVGVTRALGGMDGVDIYPNAAGVPVVGAYNWLQDFDLVLLTEVPVEVAIHRPALEVMVWVVGVGLAMIALVGGGTYGLLQQSMRPLRALTERVRAMAQGDLDQGLVVVETQDEVGALARAFNQMSNQLRGLYAALESKVSDRSTSLALRSQQFEAAAKVSRAAAAIRNVDRLLAETVRLISEHFDYYHAGIFLVDESGKYAVLQAASSEGGRRMLARGHKLAVGYGIVGAVAETREARIALDVGEDLVFFDNPDLPKTRSEIGLPLKVRDHLIGVLDVQSTQAAAFSDDDIVVLQTMADQVALAIQNARLIQESTLAVQELERRYGGQVRTAWQERLGRQHFAFHYNRVRVSDASDEIVAGFARQAPAQPEIHELPDGRRQLVAAILLRGQTLGTLVLEQDAEARPWSSGDLALVSAVCDQIGQALDNARLLDQAQVRADRERLTGEIAATVRESAIDVDSVLQTTLRELGQALRASGFIQLTGAQATAAGLGDAE